MGTSMKSSALALSLLLVVTLCNACLVTTKSKTLGEETLKTTVVRTPVDAGEVFYRTTVKGAQIEVWGVHASTCQDQVTRVIEKTTGLEADFSGPSGGGEVFAVAAVLFLPVTVLSAIITSATIASSEDKVSIIEVVDVETVRCGLPTAPTTVRMILPSGGTIEALTNSKGKALFQIPATESDSGEVVFSVAGLGSWTADYQRDVPVAMAL
jgi:hypothetical protein